MEYLFTVICSDKPDKERRLHNATDVTVYSSSESGALRKAKKIAPKRASYFVRQISEPSRQHENLVKAVKQAHALPTKKEVSKK